MKNKDQILGAHFTRKEA